MTRRRIRKPPIQPEIRQNWFERFARFGESAAEIAVRDKVDIRTVRKHIELARREVELHQAKATTLLNAMQEHNNDLCAFAKKLDNLLNNERNTLPQLKEDPFWPALHQHLPRSIIWRNLDKWEQLRSQISQLNKNLEESLEAQIKARLKSISISQANGLENRIFRALILHIKEAAQARPEILEDFDFNKIPESADSKIADVIRSLLSEAAQWPEYTELVNSSGELGKVHKLLHDEFLIITLRRVVPGKCRYCPV